MAAISRFEDIDAWKKARVLTRTVYEVTRQQTFAEDLSLRDQIRRAAVSVMANIAEGFERDGDKEFRQFLSTAKGSVGEVKSHLYVALDAEFITTRQFQDLYALENETGRMIAGFMKYLTGSSLRGAKYKNEPR